MQKLFIALSLFLALTSCRKTTFDNSNQTSNIKLPDYSENGNNTFGFMLDNSIWTVFGKHYYNIGIGSGWTNNLFEVSSYYTGVSQISVVGGGRLSIVAKDTPTTDISAGFTFVPTLPYAKTYFLTGKDNPGSFSIVDIIKNKRYVIDTLKPFAFQITKFDKIDSLVRICSGRFNGILYNEIDKADSIIVRDGRFDTKVIYK